MRNVLSKSANPKAGIGKIIKMWNFQRKKRLERESKGQCIDPKMLYGKTLLAKRGLVIEHDFDINKKFVSLPSS
jgi:hypothetical protein